MRRTDLKLRYLATGCPHSGTGYVARLLTSAGVPCGHENVFQMDTWHRKTEDIDEEVPLGPAPWGFSWEDIRAESAWPAAYHLTHPCLASATIIHIVRDPLKVIRSLKHIDKKIGFEELAQKYLARNWLIENIARCRPPYIRYHVEERLKLLELLDIHAPNNVFDDPTYNNHTKGIDWELTWENLIAELDDLTLGELIEMSNRYGYGGPE